MLFSLIGNVQTMSLILCGKYSKHPQKDNETTLPICYSKGTVRLTLLIVLTKNRPHNSVAK